MCTWSEFRRALLATVGSIALLTGTATAQNGPATTLADIIFAVDESGSMGGEQDFLQDFAPDLDAALAADGFTDISFGLTGFGSGLGGSLGADNLGRQIDVGGGQLGSAADFQTAANNLLLSGGFEDGYSAIDFILNNYATTPGASVTIVLVTDEDRDDGNAALDFNSIEQALASRNINLVSIVDADITDDTGAPAIGTDGQDAFVQDNSSFVRETLGVATSNEGATEEDYIDLSLALPEGCVGDLNFLRAGGDAATAFAEVVTECIAGAAAAGPAVPGGVLLFLNVYRDTAMTLMNNHRNQTRQVLAVDPGAKQVQLALASLTDGSGIMSDYKGLEGFRVYILGDYQFGDFDEFGNNKSFDYDTAGTIIGFDYTSHDDPIGMMENAKLIIGGSFGYQTLDAEVDFPAGLGAQPTPLLGTLDVDAFTAQVNASVYQPEGLFFLGAVRASRLNYEQRRFAGGNVFGGDPDGYALGVELEAGVQSPTMTYESINPNLGFQISPFISFTLDRRAIDGFQETNGGVLVDDIEDTSVIGRLGARFTTTYETPTAKIFGTLEVAGAGDLLDDGQNVPINSGQLGTERIEPIDTAQIEVRAAVGGEVTSGVNLFAQYAGGFSEHASQHAFSGVVEVEF